MPPPQWFQRDQLIMWCSQADGCAWESTLQQKPYQTPIGQKKIGIISPLSCRRRQQLRQRWIYDSAAQLGGNNGKRSIRGCSWSLLDASHGGWRVESGGGLRRCSLESKQILLHKKEKNNEFLRLCIRADLCYMTSLPRCAKTTSVDAIKLWLIDELILLNYFWGVCTGPHAATEPRSCGGLVWGCDVELQQLTGSSTINQIKT